MLRNEAGNTCGKNVVATLSRYAALVPKPISVNMFGLRLTSDAQKRSKNGQPPHNTTGVANANSIKLRTLCVSRKPSANIDSTSTGNDIAALTQNRRRIESYSGSASTSAKTSIGSSAIPHFGHAPGPICTISGSIGQVLRTHCTLAGLGLTVGDAA